jgi:hypothetical protein
MKLRADILTMPVRSAVLPMLALQALNVPLTESNVLFIEQLLQHVYASGCDHGAMMETLRAEMTGVQPKS